MNMELGLEIEFLVFHDPLRSRVYVNQLTFFYVRDVKVLRK